MTRTKQLLLAFAGGFLAAGLAIAIANCHAPMTQCGSPAYYSHVPCADGGTDAG